MNLQQKYLEKLGLYEIWKIYDLEIRVRRWDMGNDRKYEVIATNWLNGESKTIKIPNGIKEISK